MQSRLFADSITAQKMTASDSRSHGPWQIVRSNDVYKDPWLSLRQDDVIRPDGKPGSHSVVNLKPGICVLAYEDGHVFLTEEFHYGVGRVTLEAVSGGIESGEEALVCAQRELAEELGIAAAIWESLSVVDPFTASVVSPTQLYLATGLTFQEASPEGTEQIVCKKMRLEEAKAAVDTGQISHAPSCIAVLQLWIRQLDGRQRT